MSARPIAWSTIPLQDVDDLARAIVADLWPDACFSDPALPVVAEMRAHRAREVRTTILRFAHERTAQTVQRAILRARKGAK